MERRLVAVLVIAVAFLLAATAVQAFDSNRKGFTIGLGGGLGITSFTQEIDIDEFGEGSLKSDRETDFGFGTDFRIGWGFSNQFMLYYENRVSWFGMESLAGDVTIANGVGLVGASYYLQEGAPSVYILGSIGTSAWMAPFEEDSGSMSGFGISGGLGYEFRPHLSVEGTVNLGWPSEDEVTTNAAAVLVTLCYNWY